jgi:hypothetical protein
VLTTGSLYSTAPFFFLCPALNSLRFVDLSSSPLVSLALSHTSASGSWRHSSAALENFTTLLWRRIYFGNVPQVLGLPWPSARPGLFLNNLATDGGWWSQEEREARANGLSATSSHTTVLMKYNLNGISNDFMFHPWLIVCLIIYILYISKDEEIKSKLDFIFLYFLLDESALSTSGFRQVLRQLFNSRCPKGFRYNNFTFCLCTEKLSIRRTRNRFRWALFRGEGQVVFNVIVCERSLCGRTFQLIFIHRTLRIEVGFVLEMLIE